MIEEDIKRLRREILAHKQAYFAGQPTIDADGYDRLVALEAWLTEVYCDVTFPKGD